MSTTLLGRLITLTCFSAVTQGFSQAISWIDDFLEWKNASLGGGGFCMEIRFDPHNIYRIGNHPTLYLATHVSGLYRSSDLGENWTPLWHNSNSPDERTRYVTTIAFDDFNDRIVIGSRDGIFYASASNSSPNWALANMPDRATLETAHGLDINEASMLPGIGRLVGCSGLLWQ